MATWKLKRTASGISKTLEVMRVRDVTRKLINQAYSTAEISWGGGSMLGADPFDDREEVQVLRDEVVWFRGYNIMHRPSAQGATESFVTVLADAWWYLDNLVYTQFATFVADGTENPTPEDPSGILTINDFTTEENETSMVYAMEDWNGDKVSTSDMIAEVIDYAITKGVPILKGTIDTGADVGKEEMKGVTCAEVIKKCLRWTPDQTVFFDYTTSPATIHVRSRANRTALEVDIENELVVDVSITKRRDLVLSGVRIEYYQDHEREDFTFRTQTLDEVGDCSGTHALIVPIELYGSYLHDGAVVAAEAVPTGIAQILFDAWSVAHFEGRVIFVQQDCPNTDWMSRTLRIANGNPEWAAMSADIQAVTDVVMSGTTEVTIGPPQHLGVQDLVEMLRNGKTEPPDITDTLLNQGGGTPAQNKVPTDSPDSRLTYGPTAHNKDTYFTLYKRTVWLFYDNGQNIVHNWWDKLTIWNYPGGSVLAIIAPGSGVNPPWGPVEYVYSQTDAPGVERKGRAVWTVTVTVSGPSWLDLGSQDGDGYVRQGVNHNFYLNGAPNTQNDFDV